MKSTLSRIQKIAGVSGLMMVASIAVFAEEAVTGAAGAGAGRAEILKWLALSAPIGLGLAVIGAALGQGRMAAQAMAGIARNPGAAKDMFVPMILGLAFIEALAIYALIFVFIFRAAFPI